MNRRHGWVRVLWVVVLGVAPRAVAQDVDSIGQSVYASTCASCHGAEGASRAPRYFNLAALTPRAIVDALERGRMQEHGATLSTEQRRAVAQWLTRRPLSDVTPPLGPACPASPTAGGPAPVRWSGWGGDLEGTGFQNTERAGLTAAEVPTLELKWAFAFPDAVEMRSKPAVVGDRLIVGSQFGAVYALGAETGCVHWVFSADAAVRGAIVVGDGPDDRLAAFFVDFSTKAYALDAATGELLWKTKVGRHASASNTGSPALHDGRLFVPISSMEVVSAQDPRYPCCTSSGAVAALDATTGAELWYHRVIADSAREVGVNSAGTKQYAPSGAIVWSSPTVDAGRGLVYVGTGENYTRPTTNTSDAILALEIATGQVAWLQQTTAEDAYTIACDRGRGRPNCPDPMGPDHDFGMAPMLTVLPDGREVLVAGQKSGWVYGFDPDRNGEILWSTRVGRGGALGGIHWGMAADDRYVYATNADHPLGAMLLPDTTHPLAPGVYALDPRDGEVAWHTATPDVCARRRGCYRANSAQPAAIPGVVFAGGLDGHLRAYSTDDGKIIWDYDTAREFATVNGVTGKGGAIDGPGPVIADGMVFVNSGYGLFTQLPGNLLLAFAAPR